MQKTEKLYYFNPYMFETEASVLACEQVENGYEIVLDKTCLFPAGGGQPCDLGHIDGVAVISVREKDDVIYHLTEKSLLVGKTVKASCDPKRRVDHSCQHTGEHIISGVAHKLFSAKNVGFHMAEDYATLDFDVMLDDNQMAQLEYEVNQAVRKNLPITYDLVDGKALKKLTLRKKTEGLEDRADEFRIVYVGDVDSCTCCGTHTAFTGEIGIIKFNSWQKYKSGVRIWFLCGERAYKDYCEKQLLCDKLAKRFSTRQDEVLEHIIKQGDELSQLKRTMKQKLTLLSQLRGKQCFDEAKIIGDTHFVMLLENGADATELRMLADNITACGKSVCLILSVVDDGMIYALASNGDVKMPMNELSGTVNALFNAKGGGRPNYVQGKAVKTSMSQLEQAMEQFNSYIEKVL